MHRPRYRANLAACVSALAMMGAMADVIAAEGGYSNYIPGT